MQVPGETVLEAHGLGKIYSRQQQATRERVGRALRRTIFGGNEAASATALEREFWAVRDVDLTVRRGEALGIIGLNGSGKTTTLRMLAGQILPDAGIVRVFGRSASMIDLTAGFQPSVSGRRNIHLRGAALGRSPQEMAASEASIIDFAELGDAIDAPVATYSSGMTMRLAFAIMVASEPDILFIDEVLAVGDFRFRQKCLARLREIRERTSFVMVSHSMPDIASFCSRVLVMSKGRAVFQGSPKEAIAIYESLQFPDAPSRDVKLASTLAPQFENNEALSQVEHYWCDAKGNRVSEVVSGCSLWLHLSFRPAHTPRQLVLGVPVWNDEGAYVTGFSTSIGDSAPSATAGELAQFRLEIPEVVFNPGIYHSNMTVLDGPEFLYRKANPALTVTRRHERTWGLVTIPHRWKAIP